MKLEDMLAILAVFAIYFVASKWLLPMLGIKT